MLRPIYSLSTICYVDFDDLNNKYNIVVFSSCSLLLFSLPSKFSLLSLFLNSLTLLSSYSTSKLSYTFSILTLTLHHNVCHVWYPPNVTYTGFAYLCRVWRCLRATKEYIYSFFIFFMVCHVLKTQQSKFMCDTCI